MLGPCRGHDWECIECVSHSSLSPSLCLVLLARLWRLALNNLTAWRAAHARQQALRLRPELAGHLRGPDGLSAQLVWQFLVHRHWKEGRRRRNARRRGKVSQKQGETLASASHGLTNKLSCLIPGFRVQEVRATLV